MNQMTKQEYTAEENAASISEAASIINRAMHGSYITLMDVTKAEMEYIHHAFNVMNDRIASLEAENAKLEKLNSAALERLSYHACPSVPSRNNYGQPCNDSDDCVACWREYLGGVEQMNQMALKHKLTQIKKEI
jgi:hypothetical protein